MSQDPNRVVTNLPNTEPAEDLVGHVIGEHYDVISRLHEGSAGTLYLARHAGDGRELTVRLFPRDVATDEAGARAFNKEARTLTELRHAGLLSVVDFGITEGGSPYLVTERPAARTLRELLTRETRLPPERAVNILMQLTRALAMARGAGIMHGHLKPENVLLLMQSPGKDDVVKLQDLGVSRLMRLRAPAGSQQVVVGTPRYMSPEQIQGTSDDPRSDVYALGVMLFELLTGRAPFESLDGDAVLRKHQQDPVPSLRSVWAEVSASGLLEDLVTRMLAKKPDQRPSPARLLEEIELLPEYIGPDSEPGLTGMPGAPSLGVSMGPAMERGPSLGLSIAPSSEDAAPGFGGGLSMEVPSGEHQRMRPRPSGGPPWMLIGGAVVGLAGIVGVFAFSGGDPPPPAPEQAPAPPPEQPAVDVDVASVKAKAPKKQPAPSKPAAAPPAARKKEPEKPRQPEKKPEPPKKAEPEATAPESRLVKITVTSEPPGAQVKEGPITRGTTPATLVFPRGDDPRTLRITLEGYDDVLRGVSLDEERTLHVKLRKKDPPPEEPAPAAAEPAKTEAPAEPAAE